MKERQSNLEINLRSKSVEGKRDVVILCCFTSGKSYLSIGLYAAELGTCRLDMHAMYSWTDVYGFNTDNDNFHLIICMRMIPIV